MMIGKFSYNRLLLLIVLVLALTGCQNDEYDVIHIDYQEILSYLSYQQMYDGGFSDDIELSSVRFMDLHDTYMSLRILELAGHYSVEAQLSDLAPFLSKVNTVELIEFWDDLFKIYFYLKLVDMAGYPIEEDARSFLVNHLESLQTNYGYFIRTREARTMINEGLISPEIDRFSGFNLSSISWMTELAKLYEFNIDFLAVTEYLSLYLSEEIAFQNNLSIEMQFAAAAIIVRLVESRPDLSNENTMELIRTLYVNRGREIAGNRQGLHDIGTIRDLITIGNYFNKVDREFMKKTVLTFYQEDGFSPFIDSATHINATRIALLALNELQVPLNESSLENIIDITLGNKFYDGRFVGDRGGFFVHERIRDTYYAMILLYELGAIDKYMSDLRNFYHTMLEESDISEYSVMEMFHLLSIAKMTDITVCDDVIADFAIMFAEYVESTFLINFFFSIAVIESGVIPEELLHDNNIRNKLMYSAQRENPLQTYITRFLKLYYIYSINKMLGLEYAALYREVIDFFNENFDDIEIKLMAAQYIVRIIENEQLSVNVISDRSRRSILNEIERNRDGFLFSYGEDFPGKFDSTANIIRIIRVLT